MSSIRFPKPQTIRSQKYLNFVRSLPCCICGNPLEVEAHHPVCAGKGIKGPDIYAIPLCAGHHREHDALGKISFYDKYGFGMWELVARTMAMYFEEKGV